MCTYKVCPDPFARGRLGHLHQAIDCTSGAVVAIEVTVFPDPDTALAWYPTLDYDMQLVKTLTHPNLLQYVGLTLSGHHIHAVSEHVAGGTLQRLLGEVGPLHRAIVPQYIHGLLLGLQQLHSVSTYSKPVQWMRELVHGDLSSARVFVGQYGQLKIGCHFPTTPTTNMLYQHRVLDGLVTTTRVAPYSSANALAEGIARDFRSVLWLMVEMLVGGRIRGIDIDPPRLRQLIADYPIEQAFLEHVLQLLPELPRMTVESAYAAVFHHTYLDANVTWPQLVLQETPQQARATKATFELEQCVSVRAELSVAIDSWLHDFEATHHRPPKKKEWSPDVVDMHARLTALKLHMQDLHDTTTHARTSIYGLSKLTQGPIANPGDHRSPTPPPGADTSQRRRSTAQESFLHQASTSRQMAAIT